MVLCKFWGVHLPSFKIFIVKWSICIKARRKCMWSICAVWRTVNRNHVTLPFSVFTFCLAVAFALSYFWDSSRLVQVAVHFLVSVVFIKWLNHSLFIHSVVSELWGCFSSKLLEIMYCEYTWTYVDPGTEMRVLIRIIWGLCQRCLPSESCAHSFSEMGFVGFPFAQYQDS